MISKVPDDSEFLRHLKSTADYELYDLEFQKVAVDQAENQVIVLCSANNKTIGIDMNAIEGTMYTFIKSGCFENSHVKNIYQMYVETMTMVKFDLQEVVIEGKSGDMVYSRIKWVDHKDRVIYQLCSAGDGLVLSALTESDLKITKKALDDLDDYGDFEEQFDTYEEE